MPLDGLESKRGGESVGGAASGMAASRLVGERSSPIVDVDADDALSGGVGGGRGPSLSPSSITASSPDSLLVSFPYWSSETPRPVLQ